jgi:sialate O-acetylesterase
MVLQRAPQQATVWGHTTAGATVTTTFNGKTLTTKAGADGTWRQTLPATEASTKAYTLTFKGVAGESASLNDVLFGDVFICRY